MSYREQIEKIDAMELQIKAARMEADAAMKAIVEDYQGQIKVINDDAKAAIEALQAKFNEVEKATYAPVMEITEAKKAIEMEVFGYCEGDVINTTALYKIIVRVANGLATPEASDV